MSPAVLLLLASLPGALSASKLGPHMLGDPNDPGTQTVLAACPRVAKWLAGSGVPASIASYRQSCPGGTVVLRVYVDGSVHYAASDDPSADASDFWSRIQPDLGAYPPSQVDWLEGPNELDNLPNWYSDLATAQWYARFIAALADLMNGAGYHPLVGSIAVGNPALAGDLGQGAPTPLLYVATAMAGKPYRCGWSYHGYSQNLTQDVATESWLSLRYRTLRDQAGLQGVPLVLTEGGQDMPTGWQGRGTSASDYLAWLAWYDGQLQQDAEVVGVTLFQIGNSTDWNNFNLDPIAGQLASYLGGSPVATDAGAPSASIAFSPAHPVAGDTLQIVVSAAQGYTYVALSGTDPAGNATSQSGPAIAPAYSWTWTLDGPATAGSYTFHFSCAEGATADGTITVAPAPSSSSSSGSTGSSSTGTSGTSGTTGTSGTGSSSGSGAVSSSSSSSSSSGGQTGSSVHGSGCSTGDGAVGLAWLALTLLLSLRARAR